MPEYGPKTGRKPAGRTWSVSGRYQSVTSGARPARNDRMVLEHRAVQVSVRGHDVPTPRTKRRPVHVGDASAGLGHNQPAAGDVPGLQIGLPEGVHASSRDPTEVDRRGSQAAYGARLADERREEADDFVHTRVDVVRKAGHQHRVHQAVRRRDAERRAV